MPFLDRTLRSLNSQLIDRAAQGVSSINNDLLRGTVGELVNNFLPGAAGGVPDYSDNVFGGQVSQRIQEVIAQTNQGIAVASANNAEGNKDYLSKDWRARLRPKNGGISQFYAANPGEEKLTDYLLRPLDETGGLVWQYTPTMTFQTSAEYTQHHGHGMNYPINIYTKSNTGNMQLSGPFTANNIYEARYLLAVMTFIKVCTKSYFGEDALVDGTAGTPPPVLLLEYLGDHGFNKVPVVITSANMQLDPSVDYVPVDVGGTVTYVPTESIITFDLMPTYTPHKIRRRYSLENIANGIAYRDGFI